MAEKYYLPLQQKELIFPRLCPDHRNKLSNSRQFRIESIMQKKKICRTLKGNNLILDAALQKEKVAQQPLEPSIRSSVRNNTFAYKNYLEILLLGSYCLKLKLFLCTVALASICFIGTKYFFMRLLTLFYLHKIIFNHRKYQSCSSAVHTQMTQQQAEH